MKSASANMDPDSYKDVQKFRKTQNLVKKSKLKFEHEENTCFQKVDILFFNIVLFLGNISIITCKCFVESHK